MTDAKPMTVPRIALGVALGLLAVVALLWVVFQMSQPSALDCLQQQREVIDGVRADVEDACE